MNEPRKNMKSRWSLKYKRKINCSSPKGFSQRNYCVRQKRGGKYLEGFSEWVYSEMPLAHYGYQFHSKNDPDEGFLDNKTQAIVRKKKMTAPWGGEVEEKETKNIGGRFSSKDKILISHPRTLRVLEEKLRNSKYNFNILLIEKKQGHGVIYTDNVKEYDAQVSAYMRDNKLQKSNHITFVKNATSGHLLTPWMILHTLGHTVTDHIYNFSSEPITAVKEKIRSWNNLGVGSLRNIFQFASIQKGVVDSTEELLHELIAEYLWNGRIRVNSNSSSIIEYVKDLEDDVEKLLSSCVGEIIYDTF